MVLRRLLRRVRIFTRGFNAGFNTGGFCFAASGGRAAAVRVGDAWGGAVFWPASGGLERAAGRGFGVCGGFDGCTDDATAAGGSAASVRVGCDAEAGGAGVGSGPCRAASRSGAGVDECRRGCAATSWRGGVGCGRACGGEVQQRPAVGAGVEASLPAGARVTGLRLRGLVCGDFQDSAWD